MISSILVLPVVWPLSLWTVFWTPRPETAQPRLRYRSRRRLPIGHFYGRRFNRWRADRRRRRKIEWGNGHGNLRRHQRQGGGGPAQALQRRDSRSTQSLRLRLFDCLVVWFERLLWR